ncbi:CHC2 zinc finger domain-containing protein [Vineibacter terrae]|nr:CHC2 zinc finger domain-containing protein [Vineibacter terrae]
MRTDRRSEYAERAAAVRERLLPSEVIGRSVALKRKGRDFAGLCPFHVEKTPSFWVLNGKRFFHCFGCGSNGDVIDFVQRHYGRTFVEALELLEAESGLQRLSTMTAAQRVELDEETRARRAAREAAAREEAERKARTVKGIARAVQAIERGGPVDLYLRGRALVPPASYGIGDPDVNAGWPTDLGYHPRVWHPYAQAHHPAMVAAIRGPDGALWAVHVTFLVLADRGAWLKAAFTDPSWSKLVFGSFARDSAVSDNRIGGCIRLGEPAEAMTGGEGIETTLSCMQIWRRAGICFVSSGNMPNVDLPFGCRDFIYGADKDVRRQGERWAWRAAQRNSLARRVVVQVPRLLDLKCDFNDVVRRAAAMEGEVA